MAKVPASENYDRMGAPVERNLRRSGQYSLITPEDKSRSNDTRAFAQIDAPPRRDVLPILRGNRTDRGVSFFTGLDAHRLHGRGWRVVDSGGALVRKCQCPGCAIADRDPPVSAPFLGGVKPEVHAQVQLTRPTRAQIHCGDHVPVQKSIRACE